jgi:hypothetical protein
MTDRCLGADRYVEDYAANKKKSGMDYQKALCLVLCLRVTDTRAAITQKGLNVYRQKKKRKRKEDNNE